MKVKLSFPIPGQEKEAIIEADGTPDEVASFLKQWMAEIGQPLPTESETKTKWPTV